MTQLIQVGNLSHINYNDVKLNVDGTTHNLKEQLLQSIKGLQNQLEKKKFSMHFGYEVTPMVESLNFVVFADEAFFSVILKMINENYYGTMNKTTLDDLETFLKVLLVCVFYGKLPSFLW